MLNALTVDVEEWYQTVVFYNSVFNNNTPTDLPGNIDEILQVLDEYSTKATFFMVGSVAAKYPDMIRKIIDEGHELSSHSHWHRLVYKMDKQGFIDDVGRSLDVLRKTSGTEILGFRAPTWSILPDTFWAIEALHSLGLKYDSSIYPVSANLFRCRKLKRYSHRILNDFIEFPPSTFQFLGYNFPFAGGTFLRYLPARFIKNRIAEINQKGNPAVVYFHSWEFDTDIPLSNMSKWKYFIQYKNLSSVKAKIKLLLENFKFTTVKNILEMDNSSHAL